MSKLEECRMLTEQQVSKLLSVSLSRLRQDRMYGRGLPYHKLRRSVRYPLDAIQKYLDDRLVIPNQGDE